MEQDAKQILFVDDDKDLLVIVGDYLEHEGYKVVTEVHPKRALKWLRRNKPDLVILDIMMPEMSGVTFLNQLRSDPRMESLPIVIFTARENMKEFFEDVSVQGFIPKSTDVEALRDIVARTLGRTATAADGEPTPEERVEPSTPGETRVLVAEDDSSMARSVRQAFTAAGYHVGLVTSGPDAVERALQMDPQIVVMNYILPNMNGDEVAAMMGRIPALARTPVVLYDDSSLNSHAKQYLDGKTNIRKFVHTRAPTKIVQAVAEVLAAD